jgi:hypothetical protein
MSHLKHVLERSSLRALILVPLLWKDPPLASLAHLRGFLRITLADVPHGHDRHSGVSVMRLPCLFSLSLRSPYLCCLTPATALPLSFVIKQDCKQRLTASAIVSPSFRLFSRASYSSLGNVAHTGFQPLTPFLPAPARAPPRIVVTFHPRVSGSPVDAVSTYRTNGGG